ncbi:hypothetical protein DPEC_G00060810 [Dallia pectoralis]|uniref:Uncharacterized protein n=1 Tax=Dallia pectoralis TaxID=75939 RepID=A0ACC2H7F2_DALPE|nr:hypothetical protein DPEC_G00060810 [Dallia pectoralis]
MYLLTGKLVLQIWVKGPKCLPQLPFASFEALSHKPPQCHQERVGVNTKLDTELLSRLKYRGECKRHRLPLEDVKLLSHCSKGQGFWLTGEFQLLGD